MNTRKTAREWLRYRRLGLTLVVAIMAVMELGVAGSLALRMARDNAAQNSEISQAPCSFSFADLMCSGR